MAPEVWVSKIIDSGVPLNIVGGCCGTTPQHINLLNADRLLLSKYNPKDYMEPCVSGRVPCETRCHSLTIGEKLNVYGSLLFKKSVLSNDLTKIREIAFNQVSRPNCDALDINLDIDISKESKLNIYRYLVNQLDVSKVPFVIDSTEFSLIEDCLKITGGRPIVNSISLTEGEESFVKRLHKIQDLGAVVVVMGQDEHGIPSTVEKSHELAARVRNIMISNNAYLVYMYDPCVTPLCIDDKSQDRFSVLCLWRHFRYAPLLLGISNVSFAFKGNNAFRQELNKAVPKLFVGCSVIGNVDQFASSEVDEELFLRLSYYSHGKIGDDSIIEYSSKFEGQKLELFNTVEQSTVQLLLSGDIEGVASRVHGSMSALTEAISEVVSLYDSGKIQVIQLLQASKTLKGVTSKFEHNFNTGISGIIATCEGDIHDIGKDILKEVVSAQGIEVEDLGVDISLDKIKEALRYKHSFVALSGLISPSLKSMEKIVSGLDELNRDILVVLGGAVVTQEFSYALDLTTKHCRVVYAKDPSETVRWIKLLS